jgi:hypothetical protein
MSTQRRENRWQRSSCTAYAGASEGMFPAPVSRIERAGANGGTAPPQYLAWFHPGNGDLLPGTPAWLATNSLQSDYRFASLVRFVLLVHLVRPVRLAPLVLLVPQDPCAGLLPSWALRRTVTGIPTTLGASFSHIPIPSGFARLHPSSPQIPTGSRRRAERYDGKRDLHLQHAA